MEAAIITYNTASQPGPLVGPRIVYMAIGEACIGDPHDFLELPELFQEAGHPVVDLLSIGGNYNTGQKQQNPRQVLILTVWMYCRLDHP